MNNSISKTGAGVLILTSVAICVFYPVIVFGLSYFGGWILKVCVGDIVVAGLNMVFGTTRFTPDVIPVTCAIFATIGNYFKSNSNNKKEHERS